MCAKYYGVGGTRKGTVGNETYTITKGDNIVKAKIIHTRDARSKGQIMQRCFMGSSIKAGKQIGSDFLKHCFEFKNRRLSDMNKFNSINVKRSCILPKDFFKNENVISFGNFQVANGSMYNNIRVTEVTDNTTVYNGIKLTKTNYAEDLTTVTVAAVSTDLLDQYSFLSEGMIINCFGLVNPGVAYSAQEFLTVSNDAVLKHAKQNFILNKSDNSTIMSKGFKVVKKNAATEYSLVLLNEDFSTIFEGGKKVNDNPGFVCFFFAKKQNSKVFVPDVFITGNTAYNNVVTALNADLADAQKALKTYGIGEEAIIVNDLAI